MSHKPIEKKIEANNQDLELDYNNVDFTESSMTSIGQMFRDSATLIGQVGRKTTDILRALIHNVASETYLATLDSDSWGIAGSLVGCATATYQTYHHTEVPTTYWACYCALYAGSAVGGLSAELAAKVVNKIALKTSIATL